jgi:hypothetical protein
MKLAFGAWAAIVAGGFVLLSAHGAVPGRAAAAHATMPVSGSELAASLRRSGRAALVMVAHPACPCSRATLRELHRLVASSPRVVEVVILFAGTGSRALRDRVAIELRELAGAIPGARIVDDPGGVEASRLGARTSGTILFYDRSGALRFAGGITSSRGHEGDSAGSAVLRELFLEASSSDAGGGPSTARAAIYGCPLEERENDE